MQQLTDEDAAKLYTLALRLLTSPLESNQHTQLLVGQLPEGFPEEMSFPQNTNIIGCVLWSRESFQAIFEVAIPAHEVLMFYRQALAEVGKELKISIAPHSPHSAERLQRFKDASLRFRVNQSWKDVLMTVAPLSNDLTDLRLTISKPGIPKRSQ